MSIKISIEADLTKEYIEGLGDDLDPFFDIRDILYSVKEDLTEKVTDAIREAFLLNPSVQEEIQRRSQKMVEEFREESKDFLSGEPQ